ncbi:hypothetical protein NDI56_05645 [Haloarcula sp. S1CR25-12]|uniref:Nuclear transport factor 2 family protein n=1 Tax=Haloarcula saliterrae TaxID=2950534 RepID=A0ABU2F9E2_9EURY|nr:hypothetical protein [Haloarcula sp. S1CR25-12]MDS0258874.1 hypothetical protein [Haloarcula sp. S1CR25-12]
MRRRHLLGLTGTALTTAVAGCLDSGGGEPGTETGESSTPTESPTGTPEPDAAVTDPIYELWSAYNDEDAAALVTTYHPDSPSAPGESDVVFQGTVTVESTTVVSRSGDSATAEAEASISGELNESATQIFELRRHEGEWKVWSYESESDGSSEPVAPQAAFTFEFDEAATDDTETAVLGITHSGGDTIDADRLYVRGTGIVETAGASPDITAPDTDWGGATGVSDITAGTEITVGVTVDCAVRLVWEAEGSTATLATYDGPGA